MGLPPSEILASRLGRAREAMARRGLGAFLVTAPANVRYLANHVGTAGLVVLTREAVLLLVDFRYREAVHRVQASDAACPGLVVRHVEGSYDEALVETIAALAADRQGATGALPVGFEAGHLTVERHEWLRRTLAGRAVPVTLEPTSRVVEQARMVKDASEIGLLRAATGRIGAVAEAAFAAVRAGATERAVAGVIEAAIREAGYERAAFDTIVASGPNGALPHHRCSDRALAQGDLVVLDFGGVLDGYCCDLTRTVSVGAPVADARRLHAAVREAQAAAIDAIRPGVSASEVDAAARRALGSHGLAEAFGHGTGHGLGLDVHEEPRIGVPRAGTSPMQLEPGMVFTVEPGVDLPGLGGVRIEDDVLVTDGGCEVLTAVPRELLALG